MSTQPRCQRFRIGYALAPKKGKSLIQPSLLAKAIERGINLIPIDPKKPLIQQGPFDCILHKLYGTDWTHQLQQFSSQNPNVPIIDSPESIERLHNRISMLEVVTELKLHFKNEKFGVPNQVVISELESLAIEEMKLNFPVIAKPLVADGSVKSHQMYLIFDSQGLESMMTPIVLQEFVNHGGFIFKVYVAGSNVKCVKRKSLPDISEEKLKSLKGFLPFSRISNLIGNDKKIDDDGGKKNQIDEVDLESVEMPSQSFLIELARGMREALGLNLFNFDVIRDARNSNRYLIIDVNYFPGYAKMPGYESILTDFFLQLLNTKSSVGVTE